MSSQAFLESVREESRVTALDEVRDVLTHNLSQECLLWELKLVVEKFSTTEWFCLYVEYVHMCLQYYASAPVEWQHRAYRGLRRDLIALIHGHMQAFIGSVAQIITHMEEVERQCDKPVFIEPMAKLAVVLSDTDRQTIILKKITASSMHVNNSCAYSALQVLAAVLPEAAKLFADASPPPLPTIRLH